MTIGLNVLLPTVLFPFTDWGPRLFCCNSSLLQDLLDMPWKAVPSYILLLQTEMPGQDGQRPRAIESTYRQGFSELPKLILANGLLYISGSKSIVTFFRGMASFSQSCVASSLVIPAYVARKNGNRTEMERGHDSLRRWRPVGAFPLSAKSFSEGFSHISVRLLQR